MWCNEKCNEDTREAQTGASQLTANVVNCLTVFIEVVFVIDVLSSPQFYNEAEAKKYSQKWVWVLLVTSFLSLFVGEIYLFTTLVFTEI